LAFYFLKNILIKHFFVEEVIGKRVCEEINYSHILNNHQKRLKKIWN